MWISFTLLAALFQSMRTAHQNTLSKESGTLHATLARSLFGLPFVFLYCWICSQWFGSLEAGGDWSFYLPATLGALTQIAATYFMLRLFKTRSYASGILFVKTEALMTALLGLAFFAHTLTWLSWLGIFIGVIGILILSQKNTRPSWRDLLQANTLLGLASGFCFAVTSVCVAYASNQLLGHFSVRAGVSLAYVLLVQTLVLWLIQTRHTGNPLHAFRTDPSLSGKVGLYSALGSIGWFTAFSLVHPALVKTLGQIEVMGTLYYSKFRFAEPLHKQEWLGGGLILLSVMSVAMAAYFG